MEQQDLFNTSIFVFGSNTAGIHGAGAAKVALSRFGAKLGQGFGLQGKSFAIPTKNRQIRTLPLEIIRLYIEKFINFAKENPQLRFNVTRLGTGLAGYTDEQIAPMFENSPKNCVFDKAWEKYLGEDYLYFSKAL